MVPVGAILGGISSAVGLIGDLVGAVRRKRQQEEQQKQQSAAIQRSYSSSQGQAPQPVTMNQQVPNAFYGLGMATVPTQLIPGASLSPIQQPTPMFEPKTSMDDDQNGQQQGDFPVPGQPTGVSPQAPQAPGFDMMAAMFAQKRGPYATG